MLSILGWLVKIFNLLQTISQQNTQILKSQQQEEADIAEIEAMLSAIQSDLGGLIEDVATIKRVLGIGVPVSETIIFGQPKP